MTRQSNGFLGITEMQYRPAEGTLAGLPGTLKLGGWYQFGGFPDFQFDNNGMSLASPTSSGFPLLRRGDFAVYAIADQTLWVRSRESNQGIGIFLRAIGAPGDRNYVSHYLDAGVVWKGPSDDRPQDRVGLAVGYARIGSSIRNLDRDINAIFGVARPVRDAETVIEFTYQAQLTPWCTMQPDVQYVIQPGGNLADPTDRTRPRAIKNAIVLGLRTTVLF